MLSISLSNIYLYLIPKANTLAHKIKIYASTHRLGQFGVRDGVEGGHDGHRRVEVADGDALVRDARPKLDFPPTLRGLGVLKPERKIHQDSISVICINCACQAKIGREIK